MTSTCTFAPTNTLLLSNRCAFLKNDTALPYHSESSGQKIFSAVSSWFSSMHNSLQYLHNSNPIGTSSIELTIAVQEYIGMPKSENLLRLDQIAKLEENWNGYDAKAFSKELIEECKKIVSILDLQPTIFPTGRQSIQFQYELKDKSYLEFEIYSGRISCLEVPKRRYSDARTFEFPFSEFKKIKEIVQKFYEHDGSAE